jgi:Gram-negative bacterial TonB protein C-terminal
VFDSIKERAAADVTADCAFTRPLTDNVRFAFCFEKESGVLLEKVFPEKRPQNLLNLSCEYGRFQKFGDYIFPREVDCLEDRHKSITATVVELSIEHPIDPALFDPPPGAIQLGHCSTKVIPPARYVNGIMSPWLDPEDVAWLSVWLVVDEKGKPQDLRVLRTADKHAHENAWNTIRNWHFKPGTCDGKPMPMPLTLEIPSTPH